jgi:acetyl-CoA carboxylase biotin carboxyl carrier protein
MTKIPTDPEQIRLLAAVMAENGLTELELADKDTRIRVVRSSTATGSAAQIPVSSQGTVSEGTPRHGSHGADSPVSHIGSVTSPMVGIAFLAPEPGAPSFVSVGQRVSIGQTLLLIEAMKTFNQIKAPRAGTVTRIVVQNSAPVEYGELLMIVE